MIGNLVGMFRNRLIIKWIVCVMNDMKMDIVCFCFGCVYVIVIMFDEIVCEVVKEKDLVFVDRLDFYFVEYISCG